MDGSQRVVPDALTDCTRIRIQFETDRSRGPIRPALCTAVHEQVDYHAVMQAARGDNVSTWKPLHCRMSRLGNTWSLDPRLVWGLFPRGIGLILLISFASLSAQVAPSVGSKALVPIARRLAKLREDFPTWRRFFYFPTLLWFGHPDWFLRALPRIGMLGALLVIYGGPLSVWALGLCYVCYLSLDLAISLVLPWDSLLFETVVLALFIPPTRALPQLEATAAAAPALAWAFRLLLFRVMFGFGKQKFMGSRAKDAAYLQGFLINQPLLSPGGWYAQKLPLWILKGGLYFMFLVEIPAPFFAFFPGPLSLVCAALTAALMLGIQVTGNFGYFSLLTIVGTLPLLDNITPRAFHFAQLFVVGQPWLVNAFVVMHTLAAIGTFPFNSWLAQAWHQWAFWYQLPRWFQVPLDFYRVLHPFRWLHPYGVFPPNTTPGVKITLLVEVSWDKHEWHEVRFQFAPSHPKSAPHFVAPHHPRVEQAIVYDTFGMNYTSLLTTILVPWDPSVYCMRSPSTLFCQSLLQPGGPAIALQSGAETPKEPFRAVRITTVLLDPVSLEEKRATGDWWKRSYIGPHTPPQELDPQFQDDLMGEPELWQFDAIFWRRRSSLRPLMKRALSDQEDPLTLALLGAPTLSNTDVERFWRDLVPLIGTPARENLETAAETVSELQRLFTRKEQRAQYRLLNRFALILVSRFEPLFLHRAWRPLLPVRSYFHLWMLAHYIIGCGRDAYLAALKDPMSAAQYIPALTAHNGLYALALFRLEDMTFDAQKLRLLEVYFHPHDVPKKRAIHARMKAEDLSPYPLVEQRSERIGRSLFGLVSVWPHLREAFRGPRFDHGYPELYPVFDELDSGAVIVGSYPPVPEGTVLADDLKSVPS
jgi:hypothetical protein